MASRIQDALGALRAGLKVDSALWRRALRAGVVHGPEAWVRYSPPLFGIAFGALLREPREAVRATQRKLLGPRSAQQEWADVARLFSNFACCLTDSFLLGAARGYYPTVRSANDGADFKRCQAEGRGVILATAHTAGWDVAGPMLSTLQSAEVMVVMEPEANALARRMHDEARRKAGVRVVHAGNDPLAALPLLQHLRKRQGIVAMKFDRRAPGMRSREVTFLGERWQVPEGPLKLAAVSGAPILPVFTRRLGFLEYEFVTAPPIHVGRRASDTELDDKAQQLATFLEEFARANPCHWFRFSQE